MGLRGVGAEISMGVIVVVDKDRRKLDDHCSGVYGGAI